MPIFPISMDKHRTLPQAYREHETGTGRMVKRRKLLRMDRANPKVWILRRMNSIRACAREIVNKEIIYT